MDAEHGRLEEARTEDVPWKKWGPYLADRQWGTVREDYSENGDAWNFFTHDHARSRAYRWGPILKERLFGLTNSEGNHGEDVKEYYFYLDSTPSHSYMKFLYKYPQAAYPYADLVETNRRRRRYVRLPFPDLPGRPVRLKDLMGPASYDRDGGDLASRGLYLDLPPWSHHVFDVATP